MNSQAQPELAREALLYSCSGASNLGRLTNDIAVRLDRLGLGEMSCLAAVAAEAEQPLDAARSGRPVIAISGCALGCAEQLLESRGVEVSQTVSLALRDVLKAKHVDVGQADRERIFREVLGDLGPFLIAQNSALANPIKSALAS